MEGLERGEGEACERAEGENENKEIKEEKRKGE